MFTKAFLINLPFKTDRLAAFQASAPKCLGEIEVWPAVHGDSIAHPDWWTAGAGAWGCYRSHMQILEHCYQNNIESYIVFEDDAVFREGACDGFEKTMADAPIDWQQIYFGGQLLHETAHPPRKVSNHIYIPYNVNRTHAFAVHRRGYEALYKHLNNTPFNRNEHIDHHLGRLHESGRFSVYCPGKWLVGQAAGPSNISGHVNEEQHWPDPEQLHIPDFQAKTPPCVFLESPIDVAVALDGKGWHRGHWKNEQNLDRGVCDAVASIDVAASLMRWHRIVVTEAIREGKECACLFHPSLTWDMVKDLQVEGLVRIQCSTADEAECVLKQHKELALNPLVEARKRNLVYHIWPKMGNGVWQWNVENLIQKIKQFDGVRIIGVATDADSDTLDDVKKAFDGVRVDHWVEAENSQAKGETTTFSACLELLPMDDSITFRAHAKGVRHSDPGLTREWTRMMYQICLNDEAHVEAAMRQYSVCGPFLLEDNQTWHFSGAFYWFRNSAIRMPEARLVDDNYFGAEFWPPKAFQRSDAGCLFGHSPGILYEKDEQARMRVWLDAWVNESRVSAIDETADDRQKWVFSETMRQEKGTVQPLVNLHRSGAHVLLSLGCRTVIELGSGIGAFLIAAQQIGLLATGVDINKYCRDFALSNGVDPTRYLLHNLSQFRITMPVDGIYSTEVFEHLRDSDLDPIVSQIADNCKHFYFTSTPNTTPGDKQWGHINIKSKQQWIAYFAKHGLKFAYDETSVTAWGMLFRGKR